MAVSDGDQIVVYKEMGLVSQVFTEGVLASLQGHLAIGHCRYSTTGVQRLGERPADLPHHRHRPPRAGPQREPHQHPRAGRSASPGWRPAPARCRWERLMHATSDTDLLTALLGRPPGRVDADRGGRRAAARARRLQPRLHGRHHALRRPRPAGHPPAGDRPPGRAAAGWWPPRRPRWTSSVPGSCARSSRARSSRSTSAGCAADRFATAEPKGCLFEYVYLARPDTRIAGRSVQATRVEIGPGPGPRAPGRGRPGHPGPGVRDPRGRRLRAGQRHPVRPGPGEERLRGADVHPAVPDHPPAGHPAEAQPPARGDRGQAPRGRRRLDRARQHPARDRADAARGRRRARSTCGSPARR